MRILLVLVGVAALVLGYGYYHAATHGALYISVLEGSVRPYSGNVRDAEIRLFDKDDRLLADARSDHRYGVVRVVHPEVGDCAAAEENALLSAQARNDWHECFERVSRWVIGWADRVRKANVKFGSCDIKAVPVTIRKSQDWWLWWVPLSHVGGKPYTYFTFSIDVVGATCTAAKRRP